MVKIMKKLLFLSLLTMSGFVYSSSYECVVTRKLDSEKIYPKTQLDLYKYSVRIKDEKNSEVDRCSFTPSEKRVTCDKYSVDKVEVDKNIGIKKFYYFTFVLEGNYYKLILFIIISNY